jgi:hypothetical protein
VVSHNPLQHSLPSPQKSPDWPVPVESPQMPSHPQLPLQQSESCPQLLPLSEHTG